MAIESNASEVAVGSALKQFTGISEFNVVAVNPTLEKLHELGIMLQTEPNYEVSFGEDDFTKIVFWLKNEDVTVPCEILVKQGPWKSKTGKYKWYNRVGQETWAPANDDGSVDTSALADWFKEPDTCYTIPRGMDTVTELVRVWANVAQGGEIKLETVNKIAAGDTKELEELLTVLKDNQVRVLAYVRDGKYQAVYTRHFGRVNPKRNDLFVKALNDDYGAIKGDYTLEWQKYAPGVVTPDAVEATDDTTDDDWDDGEASPF